MDKDLVYLVVIFVLPLVVASVLYWVIPSGKERGSAGVGGILYGLKIKATGPIAVYIILLWVAIQFASSRLKARQDENNAQLKAKQDENGRLRDDNDLLRAAKETWKIVGDVVLSDSDKPEEYKVQVIPPLPHLRDDGHLDFNLRIPPKPKNPGAYDILQIAVSRDGYKTVYVPLDPDAKSVSGYNNSNKYNVEFKSDGGGGQVVVITPAITLEAAKQGYNPPNTQPERVK